jgi:hypothetical protein
MKEEERAELIAALSNTMDIVDGLLEMLDHIVEEPSGLIE